MNPQLTEAPPRTSTCPTCAGSGLVSWPLDDGRPLSVRCASCKGAGYLVALPPTNEDPKRGRYTVDESKVIALFHPTPRTVGMVGAHAARAVAAGRSIRLTIAPRKVCRLSPAHARRVAAELLAAADQAERERGGR